MSRLKYVLKALMRSALLVALAVSVSSCDPQVYGSVGVSNSSWNRGGSGMHGSISVGGRICC
jgi:hypothetical protein